MFKLIFSLMLLLPIIIGCSGVQTFPNMARAGDTVSVALGWQKEFKRSNTTVTVTPSIGEPIVYLPNDPAVRAIINFYPDPLSNIVIGTKTENDMFKFGQTYGWFINNNYTDGDMDWWQTMAFVNLPSSLALGEANIQLSNSAGDIANSIVNIVEGSGEEGVFNAEGVGPLAALHLESLERTSNFEVSIESSVIPYAVEMEFTYSDNAIVVNPNDLKNIQWSNNSPLLKVMLLPASLEALSSMHDFKFYITGVDAIEFIENAQPLTLQSIKAYDINGNEVTGVTASIVEDYRF